MWKELIEAITDQLNDHWIKLATAAAFMIVGWYFGRRRERRNWTKREFLDRLNISLTYIEEGTLRIRTLIEKDGEEVFLNKHAVATIRKYAEKTVPTKPIIPIPEYDSWFFLNGVLNEISEKYSAGLIAAEAGLPVEKQQFLICLTNEADGAVRTRKIRAMIVRKSLLLKLPDDMPKLENPWHRTRWETLKTMAEAYEKSPFQFAEVEVMISK